MFQTSVTLSILNVFIGIGIAIVLGLLLWRTKTRSLKKRIVSLEREMLSNHAAILELQKERTKLELLLKKENPSIFNKEGKIIESALKSIQH